MKRDFSVNIKDQHGAVLTEVVDDGSGNKVRRPITAYQVIENALMTRRQNEEMTGEMHMIRYNLNQRVVNGGLVDITSEEATLIKKQIAMYYPTLIYGFIHNLLETDPVVTEKE